MSEKTPKHPDLLAATMSTERPLDALLPELRGGMPKPPPMLALTPIHQRVLEVETDDGREWVLTCLSDPGDARALHKGVLALLEATLLAELSQTPDRVAEGTATFEHVRLIVFPPLAYAVAPAVQAFGMRPEPYDAEAFAERVKVLRGEARALGVTLPESPSGVWHANIAHATGAHGEALARIEARLAELQAGTVWGEQPGVPSHMLSQLVRTEFGEVVEPTLDGVRTLELLLVGAREGVIRWMRPLLFQALCDFVGVVAQAELGADVAWAMCEEEATGFAPPPLFRVHPEGGKAYHVPIGHHVLRWSMMPLAPGEQVPSLAEWLVDQFRPS